MKMLFGLQHVDLSKPHRFDEFTYLAKRVDQNLPLVDFAKKFPPHPMMPIIHEAMLRNPGMRQKKFRSELYLGDQELMRMAYQVAISQDEFERVDARRITEQKFEERAQVERYENERDIVQRRLEFGIEQRIMMQKSFIEKRIQLLDEFKDRMYQFFKNADERQKEVLRVYIRQAGLDPSSQISNLVKTPTELAKIQMEERRTREIIESRHQSSETLQELRERIASQNAALVAFALTKKSA